MQLQVDGAVLSCQFADDFSEGLVTTSAATMWHLDLSVPRRVPLLSAHADDITSFVASPSDAQLIASTSRDGVLRVWQITSGDVRSA
jgi:WD40 repeat protein